MIAAILHDVIEDTPIAKDEITTRFGTGRGGARRRRQQARPDPVPQPRRSAGRELPQDAARHGARHPRDHGQARRPHAQHAHARRDAAREAPPIARETLDIYAPIANRLGMHAIKLELEDLGFRALYPLRYKVIETAVTPRDGNQKQFVGKIDRGAARTRCEQAGIEARIEGREKHMYSIYEKMRRKKLSLNEIMDVFGFRIVVDKRRHLLSRARRRARRVQADAGPLQGLHRDPARQRLPVAAHDAVRPERHADRSADPHRGDAQRRRIAASRRTGSTRAARHRSGEPGRARASGCSSWSRSSRAATPRSSSRASRSICSPTRSTCSRRKARSSACRAARPASTSRTPCTPTSATAASRPRSIAASCRCARRCATARPSRSSPRRARTPNPAWVELRRHGQGARVDPAVPQEPEARRSRRNSAGAC